MQEIGLEWTLYKTPVRLKEVTAPALATMEANTLALYAKDNAGTSALYYKNDAGLEIGPLAAGTLGGTGVSTRVAYWSATSTLTGEANFIYDSSVAAGLGKLMVQGEGAANNIRMELRGYGASDPVFQGARGSNTIASPTATVQDAILIALGGAGYNNTPALTGNKALISLLALEAWTTTAQGTWIRIEATVPTTTTRQEVARFVANTAGGLQVIGGGVGITSGSVGLEIVPKAGQAGIAIIRGNAFGTGNVTNFQGAHARGTSGSPTATQADDVIARVSGLMYGASQFSAGAVAAIDFLAAENASNTLNGTYMTFATTPTGGSVTRAERMRIDPKGNVIINTAAIATNATDGFLYIPSCAGVPTGVPTTYTGRLAHVYDSSNNKLYVYNGGWKGVTLA